MQGDISVTVECRNAVSMLIVIEFVCYHMHEMYGLCKHFQNMYIIADFTWGTWKEGLE